MAYTVRSALNVRLVVLQTCPTHQSCLCAICTALSQSLQDHATEQAPTAATLVAYLPAEDRLLKVYSHLLSGSTPSLLQLPLDALPAVIQAAIGKQDWNATVAAALALAEAPPSRAAKLIAQAVDMMHSSGIILHVAAKGMPVLQQAERHADVVKVANAPLCCPVPFDCMRQCNPRCQSNTARLCLAFGMLMVML